MFDRVLVANRGEIAVRVIRACRDLGISPVTVHSAADRESLHVRIADESVEIGGAASRDSYLRGDRVIEAARTTGADAVHPGYGFLAENAAFAARCIEAGVTFVGPSPKAMRTLGDKASARAAAVAAGVPVAAGSDVLESAAEAGAEADRIGFPLLIKACAGGGGMGMRVVGAPEDLGAAFTEAASEAEAAFGDPRVFLERFVERPRHVEVQVFGDRAGSVIHLGERDCSIQRRNQKLVEESPCPVMTPELRQAMGASAVRLARDAGYENAGTVEFLLDPRGNHFFLEMNTRLQVEHPVTELVTGLDLVALQLRVASGAPLPLTQEDVILRGAALELRITAEDPFAGFTPATGRVELFRPPDGPGIRCDAGIDTGSAVSPHYDPLLAKIIVSGPDRETVRRRALRAVRETRLVGVVSTLPFFERVLEDERFRSGDFTTAFLADQPPEASPEGSARRRDTLPFAVAAAAAAVWRGERHERFRPPAGRDRSWAAAGLRDAHRSRF